jgi:hypothetical protein
MAIHRYQPAKHGDASENSILQFSAISIAPNAVGGFSMSHIFGMQALSTFFFSQHCRTFGSVPFGNEPKIFNGCVANEVTSRALRGHKNQNCHSGTMKNKIFLKTESTTFRLCLHSSRKIFAQKHVCIFICAGGKNLRNLAN